MTRNLVGKNFGLWTVQSRAEPMSGQDRWHCRCTCGSEKIVYGCHLRSGKSSRCIGCRPGHSKHGKSDTPLHIMWMGMHARCRATDGEDYQNYVLRGIAVCERWSDFALFESDMGPRPAGRSIERRDNNKGYSPENCYWATPKQQMRNMRRNRVVTYRGARMTLIEASERSGVNYGTAKWRLNNGRTDEEAFS